MPFTYLDPWGQWKAPGVRKFALAAIGLYFYISYLPSRDSMRISHDPTRAASPVVASTDKISEEDVRPYWMRVWNYWGQGGEELHKEKMDWAWGEVDKSRQQSYFKLAVEPQTARKEIYLFVLFLSLFFFFSRRRQRPDSQLASFVFGSAQRAYQEGVPLGSSADCPSERLGSQDGHQRRAGVRYTVPLFSLFLFLRFSCELTNGECLVLASRSVGIDRKTFDSQKKV
jgi:hypothetical protein